MPRAYVLSVTSEVSWAGYRDDDIGRRLADLADLADRLESRLGDAATLQRNELFHGCGGWNPGTPGQSV